MKDAVKADTALIATPSQTVGPFFHFALTPDTGSGKVHYVSGRDRIQLVVRVTDGDGEPVNDAVVELWQTRVAADQAATPDDSRPALAGFGRMATGAEGACEFETVRPATPPGMAEGREAAHINVCLFARGLLRHLHTRIYFAGDPRLEQDAVLALVPEDRRATLVARQDDARPERWLFQVRLQGPQETVFFDV